MIRALLVAITVLATGRASAHDVWLTLDGDAAHRRVLVNYGHPDDRPPAFADKVLDLVAIDAHKAMSLLPGLTALEAGGHQVAASKFFRDDGRLLLAARYDNGFWTKLADGETRNVTKRLVDEAGESLWSGKFAKAVSGPGAPFSRVLGHDLELMPLSDPALVKPGETLRLRVLFHGKPLPGAEVERGDGVTAVAEQDIPRFTTDTDGIASVPIVGDGAHLIVVDHRVTPSQTPDQANADLFNATLWFRSGTSARR